MKYTVVWIPQAESELAALWLDGSIRAVVSAAAREIDRALRFDPQNVGEARDGGQRIHLVPPLGVRFEISEDDRIVRVLRVWRYGKRPKGAIVSIPVVPTTWQIAVSLRPKRR